MKKFKSFQSQSLEVMARHIGQHWRTTRVSRKYNKSLCCGFYRKDGVRQDSWAGRGITAASREQKRYLVVWDLVLEA